MKNEKHQQAKNLFFQTNLSKTEIANRLGVNRRTIMLWCQQGNWERLKQSAENLPSMVAEKCYFLLDHYASHLLSSNAVISTFGPKEANAINQMATSIKKLKNRSAINEAMEMFNFFLEYVKKHDPEMLEFVNPLVEGYIATRRDTNVDAFVPHNFTRDAKMDESIREQEIIEKWKDEDDQPILEEEYLAFLKHREEVMKENTPPANPDADEGAMEHLPTNKPTPKPGAGVRLPDEAHNKDLLDLEEQSGKEKEAEYFSLPDFEGRHVDASTHAKANTQQTLRSKLNAARAYSEIKQGITMPANFCTVAEAPALSSLCHPELAEGSPLATTPKTDAHTPTFARRSFREGSALCEAPIARRSFSECGVLCEEPIARRSFSEGGVLCEEPIARRSFSEGGALSEAYIACRGERSRTTPIGHDSIGKGRLPLASLPHSNEPLTPLQTFSLLTFLNATEPKRQPNGWTRFYKNFNKTFSNDITTLEELDEIKFSPEAREQVLSILRSGTPIPGFEKLQLKLIHADIANNNQNLAA